MELQQDNPRPRRIPDRPTLDRPSTTYVQHRSPSSFALSASVLSRPDRFICLAAIQENAVSHLQTSRACFARLTRSHRSARPSRTPPATLPSLPSTASHLSFKNSPWSAQTQIHSGRSVSPRNPFSLSLDHSSIDASPSTFPLGAFSVDPGRRCKVSARQETRKARTNPLKQSRDRKSVV